MTRLTHLDDAPLELPDRGRDLRLDGSGYTLFSGILSGVRRKALTVGVRASDSGGPRSLEGCDGQDGGDRDDANRLR